jgi:flagellar biosynthesis/type III secretory pathway protein FliH
MGEIYRSAPITGMRRLGNRLVEERDQRASQGKKGKKQASSKQPEVDAQSPGTGSGGDSKASNASGARPDQVSLEAELIQSRDLSEVQHKRIEQLEAEREELLSDLKAMATELKEASEQSDQKYQVETSAGYEAGVKQAKQESDKERKKLSREVQQLRKLFAANLEEQLQQVDAFAVEIAFAALTKVVGERFGDEEFTRAVVSKAVDSVRGARKVAVHVAQQDFELMQQFGGKLTASGQISEIKFVADPRVTVGGCMIETETGVWDARLETQLQRLRDAIEASMQLKD